MTYFMTSMVTEFQQSTNIDYGLRSFRYHDVKVLRRRVRQRRVATKIDLNEKEQKLIIRHVGEVHLQTTTVEEVIRQAAAVMTEEEAMMEEETVGVKIPTKMRRNMMT